MILELSQRLKQVEKVIAGMLDGLIKEVEELSLSTAHPTEVTNTPVDYVCLYIASYAEDDFFLTDQELCVLAHQYYCTFKADLYSIKVSALTSD